ncbi:MAG: cytochrome c-type biogenesis protein CcmH [Bryobacteraceae bacterium]
MRAPKLSMLLLTVAVMCAQMPSRNQKADVRRVGARLACKCGCSDTVATCSMLGCHFSSPAKEKIMKMQAAGVSDQGIIDSFIQEHGPGIFRGAPNAFGWVVPYVSLAAGAVFLIWFVRRKRQPKPVLVIDPKLARYGDEIEKELQNLD